MKIFTATLTALIVSSVSIPVCAMSYDEAEQIARQAATGDPNAINMLKNAADQGNARMQDHLGAMYLVGSGVPKDDTKAAFWFRKAADQGWASSQSSMGFMYEHGYGVPRDYKQAIFWFRKAADQMDDVGVFMLGGMYEYGDGVAQNALIAYALFNFSVSNNPSINNNSISNRQKMSELLNQSQIEEGQFLTRRMKIDGVSKTIDSFNSSIGESANPKNLENNMWPARPAKTQGQTSCNTRCINGSCWRTYDNGQHVHLNVPPSMDPFSGEMTFNTPPC